MKILFITLSNIGDCILTLPVLDALCNEYPNAKISCLVPERPKEIFISNQAIENVIVFNKHAKLIDKIKLFLFLSKEKFDIIVDLRNSLFGAFLPAKKRSSPLRFIPGKFKHMKDRHLFWACFAGYPFRSKKQQSLVIAAEDVKYIEDILKGQNIKDSAKIVVVAPGARSQIKRWDKENFSHLCSLLIKEGWDVVLVGDKTDEPVCSFVHQSCPERIINLCAKTSINQLAALLRKARLLITNDSAAMHLASYLDIPVVSIFGPTDENKYGPWSQKRIIVKKDIFCRPCEKASCRFASLECLSCLKVDDVFKQVNYLLKGKDKENTPDAKEKIYRRILIVRTDRIGDVLLSTPVIKALRQKYPQAYISMMVAPYARDIVEANPYLDETIIYDKEIKHRSWIRSLRFAGRLKKKRFDLAIILHPTNRMHLIIFLAGIPCRLGYNRKFGFLNNLKKPHKKQEGLRHEAEYNLDLLSDLGISGNARDLFMPIKPESEQWVSDLFAGNGIEEADKLLAINPGASCPSKIWPINRFAQVAEILAKRHNFKILIVAGARDIPLANMVAQKLGDKALNLSGKTSLSHLASILKRCSLFISNDSGPVHIASSLGIPVISIFGRNQPGLSPRRWGPLGKRDKYLHKDVGCIQCLAHNCEKEFACLKAISIEDVLSVAESILKGG
ncbi:MAG: lipopolysaccharide heptosyltransferase II [Candidatus Omnitrophica bacterium]|nr:lipopolysaccharide heptosyltransferase II [Candidatus Omnitrophota bacterium]MDD5690223.1 lipopolysaccharide heptosyltransferase II [Candidatus Omnitrophota bacterium]